MFSIDLLKGKGLPRQRSTKHVLLTGVLFLIPLLTVMGWATVYQNDCVQVELTKDQIQDNQTIIDNSASVVKEYQQIKSSTAQMKKRLTDLQDGLLYRIQVSDMLVEFVQQLPDEVFLYEMNLDRQSRIEKVKESKTKESQRLILNRNYKLILCAYESDNSDQLVRDYVDSLKSSEVLSPNFIDFKSTGRQQGQVDEKSATFYEIECVLREQG